MNTTAEATLPPSRQAARGFWLTGTLATAAIATALDAALLQQKKSFFTGGFLTVTHAASVPEAAAFLGVSFLVDASLAGAIALVLLWITARLELTRLARTCLVLAGALAPFVIWNFINYSLLSYLGDAFDLGLMFDLTGRKPGEILAVASSHMAAPAVLTLLTTSGIGAVVWGLNRFARAARGRIRVPARLALAAAVIVPGGMGLAAAGSAASDTLEDGLRRKPSGNLYTRATAALTDFDGDGYGIGGRTSDPAPFDGAIYPYALDVPGNGIDEDGVGGDLPSPEPIYREVPAAVGAWQQRPDVVLFVLESFRADAIGGVVNGKPVTPVLDAIGREGVSSARAFSHNGYTIQSRFHLFTGSLAGLRPDGSLVDDFKANGYETAYFSAQDESFGGPKTAVGFDRADVSYDARQDRDRRYSTFTTAGSLAVSHATLQERIDAFLANRKPGKPLFLYVNFHDTHYPYRHDDIEAIVASVRLRQAEIEPARRDDLHAMYLNTAANVDRALGRTLDAVTRAVGAPPAVVVTADHGESLFDEGFLGHGYALNDVQTRIPLLARGLPIAIAEPFGQTDLRDAIGAALARAPAEGAQPRIVAESGRTVFQYLGDIHRPRQIAMIDGEQRIIYDFRDNTVTLPGGAVHRPGALTGPEAEPFLRLLHMWERLMLARASGGAGQTE